MGGKYSLPLSFGNLINKLSVEVTVDVMYNVGDCGKPHKLCKLMEPVLGPALESVLCRTDSSFRFEKVKDVGGFVR